MNICLVLTHPLRYTSSIQNESLHFKEMPRFALSSFKWICLYRRGLGGALSKQPEPRGKIINTESPFHSYSFYYFYLWDNGHKASTQDLLETGQECCILLGLGQIK